MSKWTHIGTMFCSNKPKQEMKTWIQSIQSERENIPQFTIGFNKYFVQGYGPFIDNLLSGHKQTNCICEVLPNGKPVKPYLDIDIDDKNSKEWFSEEFMMNEYVPSVIESVCLSLEKRGIHVVDCDKPVVLSSHTESKFSLHIIFNVLLSDLLCVQKLVVEEVKPRMEKLYPEISAIDPVVYNNGRLFRIFLTPKPGKNNPLILDKTFASRFNQEDWSLKKILIRSLIAISVSESELQSVPYDLKSGGDLILNDYILSAEKMDVKVHSVNSVDSVKIANSPESFSKRDLSIISHFRNELELEYEDRSISPVCFRVFNDKRGILRRSMNFQITQGIECPFHSVGHTKMIGHKSNSTYISVSVDTSPYTVTCRCADEDCCSMRYRNEELSDILRIVEMRHSFQD